LVAALWSAAAIGQQTDITGAELLSGGADEKLQRLARDAKASGKKLVISAPEYWHDMVLEQVRKGGGSDLAVEVRDSFAESVLVRAEDPTAQPAPPAEPAPAETPAAPAPAAAPTPAPTPTPTAATPAAAPKPTPAPPAKPAPAPTPAAAPERARPGQATPPAVAPAQPATPAPVAATPRPATPAPKPAPTPATSTPASPAPATPAPAPAPATPAPPTPTPATPAPTSAPAPAPAPSAAATPAAAPAAAAAERSGAAEIAAIKKRLEQNLNDGAPVTRSVTQTELEVGDVIYDEGPVKAVLRRSGVRNSVYWLDGDIELRRVELKELAGNRYEVRERIRNLDNPSLRLTRSEDSDQFTAADPASAASERKSMEKRYNGGNPIAEKLTADDLEQKDVLYIGDKLVVVVRLDGLDLRRYWLVGKINLGRSELLKDGNNKYKVLQDL
jgi:hypothetical protein